MPPLRGCSQINDVNCYRRVCFDPTPITATHVDVSQALFSTPTAPQYHGVTSSQHISHMHIIKQVSIPSILSSRYCTSSASGQGSTHSKHLFTDFAMNNTKKTDIFNRDTPQKKIPLSRIQMFADDTKLYCEVNNKHNAHDLRLTKGPCSPGELDSNLATKL